MGHSRVRAKVRRRKVAALAAYSRQFTVHNTKKGISPKVDHPLHYGDLENAITCPFTGHKFVPTNPHEIPSSKFVGLTVTGYDWVEPEGKLWVIPEGGFKQPKRLMKIKKRKRNDFKQFKNYLYNLPKMNRVEYMEALVKHKTKKWERKNPQPLEMFAEDVECWKQKRQTVIERIRDFVVSVYDKLPVMGNIVDRANKKMKAIKIGEVKDIDGKGHNVNHPNLSPNDKLYKHAKAVAMNAMKMDKRILDADLLNHKHDQKRPLNIYRQPTDIKKAA